MSKKSKVMFRSLLGFCLLFASSTVNGSTQDIWTGGGVGVGSANMDSGSNWSTASVPVGGIQAVFNGALSFQPQTTTGLTLDSILFSGASEYNLLIGGATTLVTASGVQNSSGLLQTINITDGNSLTFSTMNSALGSNMLYNIGFGANLIFTNGVTGSGDITIIGGLLTNTAGDSVVGTINAQPFNNSPSQITISLGSLTFGDSTNSVLEASITGSGALIKTGTGSVLFNGLTYLTQPVTIQNGAFITNAASVLSALGGIVIDTGATFQFNQVTDAGTYAFSISGGGLLYKTGAQSLSLTGATTYTGGTIIGNEGVTGGTLAFPDGMALASAAPVQVNNGVFDISSTINSAPVTIGTLSGNTIAGVVALGPVDLTVSQLSNQTFAGTITGTAIHGASTGTFTLGSLSYSILTLTGNSSLFTNGVFVDAGTLNVNGQLGGPITVNGGTLSGDGIVGTTGMNVTINNGATLAAGDSLNGFVGTMSLPGNTVFNSGSSLTLQMDGTNIDLYQVGGTSSIGGGTVNLTTVNGQINYNQTVPFFLSSGPISGQFSGLTTSGYAGNTDLYTASLDYIGNSQVTITTQSTLVNAAMSSNEKVVALQFDGIQNATPAQNLFLNQMIVLSTPDATDVLNEASGEQYALNAFYAELTNRQFIRRLYDPLRAIITYESCPHAKIAENYCGELIDVDVWLSGGGGQTRVSGDGGLSLSEWNITLGAQCEIYDNFTMGVAGSYQHDTIEYRLNGHGGVNSWFAGIYGLYRPSCYYVLADLAYGNSKNKVNRSVIIDTTEYLMKSAPITSQITFYGETGMDFDLNTLMLQPFIGVEVASYHANGITETTTSDLGLRVKGKGRLLTTASLGIHLTDEVDSGFSVSLDLAWLYRFGDTNDITSKFTNFGTDFKVSAPSIGRNSGEISLTLAEEFCEGWSVFVEGTGEFWDNANMYNVLGGIQTRW